MTIEKLLRSLTWRKFRKLGSRAYHFAETIGTRPYDIKLPLPEGEQLIGIYENVADTLERAIVFTTVGLYLRCGEQWAAVRYADIHMVQFPATKAITAEKSLQLLLQNGDTFTLPVEGQPDPIHRPHLRDVWVVGGVLSRIVEAVRDAEARS